MVNCSTAAEAEVFLPLKKAAVPNIPKRVAGAAKTAAPASALAVPAETEVPAAIAVVNPNPQYVAKIGSRAMQLGTAPTIANSPVKAAIVAAAMSRPLPIK